MRKMTKNSVIFTICAVAVIFIIVVIANMFVVVQPGFTGVKITLGTPSNEILSSGLHIKVPFIQRVVQIDNRIKKTMTDTAAASKDLQQVTNTVSVNYSLAPGSSKNIYVTVGYGIEDVILAPAIQECTKAITAQYNADELVTKRQAVSEKMQEALIARVEPYGIVINAFNITNFNFSAEYNAAIEAKQVAQQNALQAEQELEKAKTDSQQTVVKAQAEADALKAQTDAQAYQTQKMAEAQAAAVKLIQDQLAKNSDAYIKYLLIQQWDGKLPLVDGSGSNILNLPGLADGVNSAQSQ